MAQVQPMLARGITSPHGAPDSPEFRKLVERELDAILASSAFHGSRRCSDFLRFIVTCTLDGRAEELKERTVAIEVFERDLLYDPKADGVVRIKANEVRKRLAQYYQSAGASPKVRIELPLGPYVPSFQLGEARKPELWLKHLFNWVSWRDLALAVLFCCCVILGVLAVRNTERPGGSDLERFWSPLLAGPKPVVVCITTYPLARLTDTSGVKSRLPAVLDRRRYEIPIDSSLQLGSGLIYDVDGGLAIGDALAAAAVSRSLGELHKSALIKGGQEVSFLDIKGNPSVLIGAFNNEWTLEVNANLRFRYLRATAIVDSQAGRSYAVREEQGRTVEDYALVSRLWDSTTGGPVLTIGGLRHFATQAAAEMVSDPERLKELLRALPRGWENRNIQVVLKTVLVQERPGLPQVVATHVW
jgi:hypothetical protein